MDTVTQAMQAMVLHMAVDMVLVGVEVSVEALGLALAGDEAMEEALADGMDQSTIPLMEVHTP